MFYLYFTMVNISFKSSKSRPLQFNHFKYVKIIICLLTCLMLILNLIMEQVKYCDNKVINTSFYF
ncbi:hypothetical protein pb186bvf_003522 [Paramecium bursaria]